MAVYTANKTGQTDGSAHNMLLQVESELPIVLVSWSDNFVFNDELLKLNKYVLVCFVEYGWDFQIKDTHIWGVNTSDYSFKFKGDEWKKFDNFVANNKPVLFFKRELLKKDVSDKVLPIEYAGLYLPNEIQDKETFDNRPLEVFYYWGYSSEYRRTLHAKIWDNAKEYGYMVCDNLYYLNGFLQFESNPKKWCTLNIPHYARIPMQEILSINEMSKLSISLAGAGSKCFRNSEACINSVMVMDDERLAWSYPWVHGENCIALPNKYQQDLNVSYLKDVVQQYPLYDIYVKGVDNYLNYYLPNYIKNYIEPAIKKVL